MCAVTEEELRLEIRNVPEPRLQVAEPRALKALMNLMDLDQNGKLEYIEVSSYINELGDLVDELRR